MTGKINGAPEAAVIREYFRKETELVNVPPLPVLAETPRGREGLLAGLRRVVVAGAVAGAILLLAVTAGRETYLSEAIDTVTARYGTNKKITAFLMETAESFRNEITGGTRQ